jgi:hypothetical protein
MNVCSRKLDLGNGGDGGRLQLVSTSLGRSVAVDEFIEFIEEEEEDEHDGVVNIGKSVVVFDRSTGVLDIKNGEVDNEQDGRIGADLGHNDSFGGIIKLVKLCVILLVEEVDVNNPELLLFKSVLWQVVGVEKNEVELL